MTLNDFKEEIEALGFEREIGIDTRLFLSVRRALLTLYSERSVYSTLTLMHYPKTPKLMFERLTHKSGEREQITVNGCAVSFISCGHGSFSVEKDGNSRTHNFNAPFHIWRLFVDTGSVITFSGELEYDIFNFSVFENRVSDSEAKIPVYDYPFEYDMKDTVNDFHSFHSMPRDSFNREIRGAILSGSSLILPPDFEGKLTLTYKVAPPEFTINDTERDLPIPKEMEHPAILLAAFYYLLDDEREKAENYHALYREALSAIKQNDTRRLCGGYNDVTGWCR